MLRRDYGMAVISADELIENNKEKFQRYKNPAITGVEPLLDPAMNGLVEAALRSADLSKGVVIAGYPASAEQGDFLTRLREKLNLPRALVIKLDIPDDEVRKRLTQEGATDIAQQLKDYHREFDFAYLYFPEAKIETVDGTKSREEVSAEIQKLLAAGGVNKP